MDWEIYLTLLFIGVSFVSLFIAISTINEFVSIFYYSITGLLIFSAIIELNRAFDKLNKKTSIVLFNEVGFK